MRQAVRYHRTPGSPGPTRTGWFSGRRDSGDDPRVPPLVPRVSTSGFMARTLQIRKRRRGLEIRVAVIGLVTDGLFDSGGL